VLYESPTVAGFNGQIAYGLGEVAGDAAKSRQVGGAIGYENGPLLLRAGFNRTNNATATDHATNSLYVAKYDFGPVVATAGVGINKGTGTTDSRDYIVSATVPFGVHTLMASYIRKDDRAAGDKFDANQIALAYTYNLSKRTNFYAAFSRLSNTNFTTTKFGTGDREIDLGIRHTF
jgi:predicted porin